MRKEIRLWSFPILSRAVGMAFLKLDPRKEIRNPVMFMVWVGSVFISVVFIAGLVRGVFDGFNLQIAIWLWFTVLFANFSESMAEIQGKARADALRAMRTKTIARRLASHNGKEEQVASIELRVGDRVVCETGDVIPGDGEVIEGIASVDESAITGESAPVIRESGGDRSAVTGGTKVISDRIIVRITAEQGKTFVDRLIGLVENATRQKTPGEIALLILLSAFSIIFLAAVGTLWFFSDYSVKQSGTSAFITTAVLFALLVCLIPTTIGGLLSAIGISSVSRLIKKNVLALSGRAVDAAGDIDVMLLDKTGTVTMGNRMASAFYPAMGVQENSLAEAALLASLADETPEGRSIVNLARRNYPVKAGSMVEIGGKFVPFSAKTRMSGVDFADSRKSIRKGAAEAVKEWVMSAGGTFPAEVSGQGQPDLRRRRDTPGSGAQQRGPRCRVPEGRGEGRHQGSPFSPPQDGNPLDHDHGRQSPHGCNDRRRGRSRRLHRGGHAAGKARAHPRRAEERPSGGDDRGRHERRSRPRAGRRREWR